MSELYLSDVTLRESRPRSRRLRDLGYVVRSYPETAPVSTASGSILDTILIPHYDDAGNLISVECTVDFFGDKNVSAGGLAAGGGGLSWEDLGTTESEKKISAAKLRLSSDGSVYADEQGYLHSAGGSGGGLTWADLGTNATKKKISGSYVYLSSEGYLGLDEFYAITIKSLPKASKTVIGGVKVGSGLSMASDGTLSTTGGGGDGVSQDYVDSHIAGKDVVSTTPTNGQAIVWDATNSRFKYQTISGGGGGLTWSDLGTDSQEQQISAEHIGISDDLNNALSIGSDGKLYAVKSTSGGGGNVSTSGILTANSIIVGAGSQSINASGKTIVTAISDPTDNQVPTASAVKSYVDAKAGGNFIRKDIADTAVEKITFTKGVRIGSSTAGVDITYDTTNEALKINGKAYVASDFSAGGPFSGSGDSGVDIITSLSASSTNDQVLGARALYDLLGNLESTLSNVNSTLESLL